MAGYRSIPVIVRPSDLPALKSESLQVAHNRANGMLTHDPLRTFEPTG